jgi:hypothetical protein
MKKKKNLILLLYILVKKRSLIGIEPPNTGCTDRRLHHYTISDADKMVTTLEPTVPRVLNLLWTWNFCC